MAQRASQILIAGPAKEREKEREREISARVVTFLSRFSIFCWPYRTSKKYLAGPIGPANDPCMQGSLASPIGPAKRERERERERDRDL